MLVQSAVSLAAPLSIAEMLNYLCPDLMAPRYNSASSKTDRYARKMQLQNCITTGHHWTAAYACAVGLLHRQDTACVHVMGKD